MPTRRRSVAAVRVSRRFRDHPPKKAVKLAFVPSPPHSFADASPPPVTPAWLQSPGHLRRPGDFRSYCHAPARLWPPEPSTDSLEPRANGLPAAPVCSRPAPCSRTFKGKAVTVGSRQTLHFSPWRSFVPGFASVNRAGSSPPSLPREVQ